MSRIGTTAPPFQSEDWVTGVSYFSTWRAAESGGVTVTMPILEEIAESFSSLLLEPCGTGIGTGKTVQRIVR